MIRKYRIAFGRWFSARKVSAFCIIVSGLLSSACQNSDSSGAQVDLSDWPARPTNIIVFSSAGGATDLANRAIAEGMKESLGVDVIASNMPGALGATAVNYVWNERHDGYRMVGISEGALGHGVLGLHSTTAQDWEYFIVGGTPGIVSVNADSDYQTFPDLLAAVKSKPEKLKIATSVPGCIWNLQWLLSKKVGGFEAQFVPYPGSFPSQTAALSGEVDIVWTGLGEQSEFIKSGKFRALAVFADEAIEFSGQTIPPITDYIPKLRESMPVNQFVGFALPSDTPKHVLAIVTQSFEAAMRSEPVRRFGVAKYSDLYGLHGEDAKRIALSQEKLLAWTLWEAGVAKRNPEELGIAKP